MFRFPRHFQFLHTHVPPNVLFGINVMRSSFSGIGSAHANNRHRQFSGTREESPGKYRAGGYHPVRVSEVFGGRYQIVSKLGYGKYSTVWLVKDLGSQSLRYAALKILTASSYGGTDPVYELDILKQVKETDPGHPGYNHIVHLQNNFIHEGSNGKHLCLVLDLMAQSVFHLQQRFPNKQFPAHLGRQVAHQILQALDYLHDSCGIIHTDIKPDNILIEISETEETLKQYLAASEQNDHQPQDQALSSRPIVTDLTDALSINVRLTDFGVASWVSRHLTESIQPISLRAPEVFLGVPWDAPVDIWGFACVLYEMLQGRVLFRGRPGSEDAWTAEEDQIAQMIELFGPIPSSFRERGKLSSHFFNEDGGLLHIKHLYPYSLRDLLAQTMNASMSSEGYKLFEAFLAAMLQYEPSKRKTPKELLKEPWL